jgi:hypothetical protein
MKNNYIDYIQMILENINTDMKTLLILYLIISANFLAQTFGCKTQYVLTKNMYVKHIVGFLTLLYFVNSANTDKTTDEFLFFKKFFKTFMLYVVFIFSTRMNNKVFVFFIGLLMTNFILSQYANTLDSKHFAAKLQIYDTLGKVISNLAIVFLAIGFLLYVKEKKMEYKGKFKYLNFLVGKTTCKND